MRALSIKPPCIGRTIDVTLSHAGFERTDRNCHWVLDTYWGYLVDKWKITEEPKSLKAE